MDAVNFGKFQCERKTLLLFYYYYYYNAPVCKIRLIDLKIHNPSTGQLIVHSRFQS